MTRFTCYLAVAILITKRLNTGLETNYFSTNLTDFGRYFTKKNKYFIKIDKYSNDFRKLNNSRPKKVKNIFKNNSKNFRVYFS